MLASPSLLVNTSMNWILKNFVKIPKLLGKCILLNFVSDLFQLVKFCYSALHLRLKHFRSLEERKKQHKEGLYLSDTLPRKKSTPSISPHFSSATMGRSTAPKVGHGENCGLHIQGVFSSLCWTDAQRSLKKMLNNKSLSLLVRQTLWLNCIFYLTQRTFGIVCSGTKEPGPRYFLPPPHKW